METATKEFHVVMFGTKPNGEQQWYDNQVRVPMPLTKDIVVAIRTALSQAAGFSSAVVVNMIPLE